MDYIEYAVASLITLSAVLLALLIPGGPVENRDFSHISYSKLLVFNIFLSLLGFISLVLVYFLLIGFKPAYYVAVVAGVSYLLVYLSDLNEVFPISPDEMSGALFWIEIVGCILSIPLITLSVLSILISKNEVHTFEMTPSIMGFALITMLVLVAGISIFATKSVTRKLSQTSPSK